MQGSAQLNGHNPEAHLREVPTRIAAHRITRIAELLPWNQQAEEKTASIEASSENSATSITARLSASAHHPFRKTVHKRRLQ
jgi:hypothetical protein